MHTLSNEDARGFPITREIRWNLGEEVEQDCFAPGRSGAPKGEPTVASAGSSRAPNMTTLQSGRIVWSSADSGVTEL